MNNERKRLLKELIIRGSCSFLTMAAILFIAAGSLKFTGAWVLLCTILFYSLLFGGWLYCRYPQQFINRFHEESETGQKNILQGIGLVLIMTLIVGGLDWRYSWSRASNTRYFCAAVLLICALLIYRSVFVSNPFLSNSVEIHAEHRVISTGMYGIIRHPMYLATCFTYISGVLILGSWVNGLSLILFISLFALRIKQEEQQLRDALPDYEQYCLRVKFRLIPFIW